VSALALCPRCSRRHRRCTPLSRWSREPVGKAKAREHVSQREHERTTAAAAANSAAANSVDIASIVVNFVVAIAIGGVGGARAALSFSLFVFPRCPPSTHGTACFEKVTIPCNPDARRTARLIIAPTKGRAGQNRVEGGGVELKRRRRGQRGQRRRRRRRGRGGPACRASERPSSNALASQRCLVAASKPAPTASLGESNATTTTALASNTKVGYLRTCQRRFHGTRGGATCPRGVARGPPEGTAAAATAASVASEGTFNKSWRIGRESLRVAKKRCLCLVWVRARRAVAAVAVSAAATIEHAVRCSG